MTPAATDSPPGSPAPQPVAVIGAGIVGVATAIWLLRQGRQVLLFDRKGPAAGASFGNGGVLAAASIVPMTVPGLPMKAPGMLFSRGQPLFLRWGYLPRLAPWLVRYLGHANEADARRRAAALAPIIGDSLADHQALSRGTGAERWVVPSDYLFLYRDAEAFRKDAFAWRLRAEQGYSWEVLEGEAVRRYDPAYGPGIGLAVRVGGHGRIADPGRYVADLAAHAVSLGARLVIAEVDDVAVDAGRVVGIRAGGEIHPCSAAVITTGAWSGPLARRLGIRVPLESERGYHVELWGASVMPKAPAMVSSGKFVVTPMEGRLRLAGVVEFGGLERGPQRAPFELLDKGIRAAIPGIAWRERTEWMGHRPVIADSIPLIGPVPGIEGAFVGFGHDHVGLTGGPRTGSILASLVSGRTPNIDLSPYAPGRFGRG